MIELPELQIRTNIAADPRIDHLNKVVKLLWQEVEQLRRFISVERNEVVIKNGTASIVLKGNGSIEIKGGDIVIAGSSKVTVKASSDLVLKGSKISQN
jgi:hypothetical protein